MSVRPAFPVVPASFFGTILGVIGLGNCWRLAAKLWALPAGIGEGIMLLGSVLWGLLVFFFLGKWRWQRAEARAELQHPVLCCFIGLAPVTGVLVALAVAPYSHPVAVALWALGAAGQSLFSLYRTGQLWKGGRDPGTTTPVLYLPTVAGNFVSSIGASALGFPLLAPLFFGAGVFSWLAIESIVLHRLLIHDPLPKPLRPTLGIQLAPAVVGCVAYLGLTKGTPDLFAQCLLGYGLLQALMLIRLLPWLCEQPFSASYWAYTFGVDALALAVLRFVERGLGGPYPGLAIAVFVLANLVVGGIFFASLWALVRGKYLPPGLIPAASPKPA
ncbi:MAG: dicarboxylate transporter/tellurite-resistance protein TehA [Chthoniobacteraceae bacterium]